MVYKDMLKGTAAVTERYSEQSQATHLLKAVQNLDSWEWDIHKCERAELHPLTQRCWHEGDWFQKSHGQNLPKSFPISLFAAKGNS